MSGRVCKLELDWAQHVAHGHWPPSRLCRDCVLGSAAQRPHKRVVAPQAYTLGLDLPGPYKRSQDELSQRRRYMLTAVYTVPVDVNGRPLLAESQSPDKSGLGARDQVGQTDKPSHESSAGRAEGNEPRSDRDRQVDEPRHGEVVPGVSQGAAAEHDDWDDRVADELLGSGEGLHEPGVGDASGPLEPLGGVFAGSKGGALAKNAEGGDGAPDDCEGYEPSDPPDPCELEEWFEDVSHVPHPASSLDKGLLARCEEDAVEAEERDEASLFGPVRMVELVFVEPLDSKSPGEVAGALGRIFAQLAVLQLPVARVHTDAGSEFLSQPFRRFVDSKGVLHTAAAPQDHNANGRVENVVRRLKQQIRTVILANGHDASRWAVAGKAVAAMRRSQTLTKLGWPQPTIVPYGAKTQILTRTWHRRRQSEWRPRAEDAVVLCPASLVKHGYVVLVGDMLKLAAKLFSGDSPDLEVVAKHPDGEPAAFEETELPAPKRRHRTKHPVIAKLQSRRSHDQAIDDLARELAQAESFDVEAALAVVAELAVSELKSGGSHDTHRLVEGTHHVFGQFVHGGVIGVTNNTRKWPGVASLLARVVRRKVPSAKFTSVVLSVDAQTAIHRDIYNHREYPNHLVTVLAPSHGGGLWVQSGDALLADIRRTPVGEPVGGHVLELGAPISFFAQRWHCVEPWPVVEHRVVLAAYVAGSVEKLGAQHRGYLEQLGFNLPSLSGEAAVEQQGGATPGEVLKNEKTHKNGKIPNVKSESVSPDRDEQAAECECCERDCPRCKNLFVGEESDSSSGLGCDEFLLAGVESCDGFRPVFLEEAPVSAPQGEALEEGVEQALFLEPESETQGTGNFDELLQEHCVLNRLIAHEREAFVEAFEERGLCEACEESILGDLLTQRAAVEAELRALSLREEGTVVVCSLGEAGQNGAMPGATPGQEEGVQEDFPETVLQTKIVPNWQVLQHFETWRPAVVAEYLSLTEEKQALDPVTQATLDGLTKRGVKVTIIPSKLICSIKAPKGRLKARIVACGNFLGSLLGESKTQKKHDLYSGGVDLTHLRMLLAFSSRRGMHIWSVDIKTAFLNSELLPRNREGAQEAAETTAEGAHAVLADSPKEPAEYVVLNPPRILVSKGICPPGVFLVVKKAVYGLDQSPRDWSFTRDAALRALRIPWKGKVLKLVQSLADECVWFVVDVEALPVQDPDAPLLGGSEVLGWLAVYVDDILASGVEDIGQGIIQAVSAKWTCSEPERVGSDAKTPVRFLGLELYWSVDHKLVVTQASYAQDLVQRYTGELVVSLSPLPLGLEDPSAVEKPDEQTLRKCQQVVGELLWLSIRTRVDLCYSVSKLAQWSTKDPEFTYGQAMQVLGYLSATVMVGLVFAGPEDKDEHGLSVEHELRAFTDASHAPSGGRSHECSVLFCEGSVVGWLSMKQPFATQSSCEAELLSVTTGSNYAVAHVGLARELWQCEPNVVVANDNLSAITVINSPTTSWRTRHLKIRARVLRERSDMKLLVFVHTSGEGNGADIGTKALGSQRIKHLMGVLGLSGETQAGGDPRPEDATPSTAKVGITPHVQACLRAVLLACCLCGAQSAESAPSTRSAKEEDWSLLFLMVLVSISSIAVWEGLRACVRWCLGAITHAGGDARPQYLVPETPPVEPEEEFEGRESEEDVRVEPPAAPRIEVPRMTPEEGLRRRPPMPVRDPEPEAEVEGRLVRFQYVDDVVEAYVQGPEIEPPYVADPIAAAAPPPVPAAERRELLIPGRVAGEPSGIFAQRPFTFPDLPPNPPYILRIGWEPPAPQPSLRFLRAARTEWGGDQSALYQAPPQAFREDFYQYSPDRPRVLVRWHAVARVRRFTPQDTRLPVPIAALTGRRRTLHGNGGQIFVDDCWRFARDARAYHTRQWRGRTELEVDVNILGMVARTGVIAGQNQETDSED